MDFKKRGELLKSLQVSYWTYLIEFERVIKNYLKMKEILKNKVS